MKRLLLVMLICLLSTTPGHAAESHADAIKAAQAAAMPWLALTDSGQYAERWAMDATLFRVVITQADWEQMLQADRVPLGTVQSRTKKTATFTTTLPGAPDGEYVVIQFQTRFAHKRSAVETVTPMREADGSWWVAGYYIR